MSTVYTEVVCRMFEYRTMEFYNVLEYHVSLNHHKGQCSVRHDTTTNTTTTSVSGRCEWQVVRGWCLFPPVLPHPLPSPSPTIKNTQQSIKLSISLTHCHLQENSPPEQRGRVEMRQRGMRTDERKTNRVGRRERDERNGVRWTGTVLRGRGP